MRMTAGFWTHVDMRDCFMEVLRVPYRGPKYFKAKVRWWNRSTLGTEPFCVDLGFKLMTVKIQNSDLKNWKPWVKGVGHVGVKPNV
jgi:hypothetical protein